MKRLLSFALALVAGAMVMPAEAMTKPGDYVRVVLYNGEEIEPVWYGKKWSEIKLDSSTKTALLKLNQDIDTEESTGFRISYLMLAHNKVSRVTFQSNDGDTIMVTWPKGRPAGKKCALRFFSNAGFAGLFDTPCDPF